MDMSDSNSVNEAVKKIKKNYHRIDALVNVAAVYKAKKALTIDKRETMFATNHLAPFALTTGLLEILQSTPGSKVFTVTAPSSTKIDFDNLNAEKSFSALGAFGGSKMMNLLFAFHLAKKFNGTSHASIAFHPGLVKSSLLSESPAVVRGLFNLISSSPEKTGEAIARLVLDGRAETQNGKFFDKNLKEMKAAKHAYDESIQKKLWQISEKMLEPVSVPA
jgi:NAD(P)-dependent dehydrogenase (short-subunit alcohol dehydrogenase family)